MTGFLQSPAGLVALVVGAILALVAIVQQGNRLYKYLKYNVQGYSNESVIEEALLPHLYEALMVAYKSSETLMDGIGNRLRGANKAEIARSVYVILPDSVSLLGVSWQWKKFVDQDKFAYYLQKRFDSFVDLWAVAQEGILEAILPEGDPTMGVGGSPIDDTFRIRLPEPPPITGPAWTPPE